MSAHIVNGIEMDEPPQGQAAFEAQRVIDALTPSPLSGTAQSNAAALEDRRRSDTKTEILELAEKGDVASLASALKKALELIP